MKKPVDAKLSGGVAIFVYFDIIFLLQIITGFNFLSGYAVVVIIFVGAVITVAFGIFMSHNYVNGEENNNGIFYVLGGVFGILFFVLLDKVV